MDIKKVSFKQYLKLDESEVNKMARLGYYADGRYFSGKKHQAVAFAKFRANEFGRSVEVTFVDDTGQSRVIGVAEPENATAADPITEEVKAKKKF